MLGAHLEFGAGALITEAVFLVTLLPLWRQGALGARDLGLRAVPGGRATVLAFLGLLAYVGVNLLWRQALHPAPVSSDFAGVSRESTLAILLSGFVGCVGAPVAEEVFFRGFLYRCLRNRMTVLPACLISAVLFAALHTQYSLVQREVIVAFGVITCLLYERTGSLLPGIAVHSFVDGSGFEQALTGNATVVGSLYALLAVILIARPPLRGLARLVTHKPAFGDFSAPAASSVDGLTPQQAVLHARELLDALGPVGARVRSVRFVGMLGAALVLILLVSLFRPAAQSRSQTQIRSSPPAQAEPPPEQRSPAEAQAQAHAAALPTCVAAGIDSTGGREGTCVEGQPWSLVTVNVVDRTRTLRMPEYSVRLLRSRTHHTRVSDAARYPSFYPQGVGQLVSCELSVTNTSERLLQLGVGARHVRRGSYVGQPPVELALSESPSPTDNEDTEYPPIIEGIGAPTPSILQQPPMAPGETRTGWVTFVAPPWARRLLARPGTDLDFFELDGRYGYHGSIRLWK